MISNKLIEIFLENFNYLNAKGKRKSLFSCFFNQRLTHDLEKNAKDLRADLQRLDQEQQEDSSKCREVISLIRNAFEQSKTHRQDHATWHHYRYEEYIGPHRDCTTAGTEYDYKDPYRPSKFEKELMVSLEASIRFLNEQLAKSPNGDVLELKKECCTLLHDVSHFSPSRIEKNVRSWAP